MKKVAFIIVALLLILNVSAMPGQEKPAQNQPKKTTKASVYADAKYNFKINIPKGWETIKTDEESLRLSITQTDYVKTIGKAYKSIAQILNSDEQIVQPLVNVWVVKTDKNYNEYLNNIVSSNFQSELKDKIINAFRPNWDKIECKSFLTVSKNQLESNGHKGTLWYGSICYQANIVENEENVFYGGGIVAYQMDAHTILLMTIRSEEHVITNILEQLQDTIYGIKW